jgi:hypothetical protein
MQCHDNDSRPTDEPLSYCQPARRHVVCTKPQEVLLKFQDLNMLKAACLEVATQLPCTVGSRLVAP